LFQDVGYGLITIYLKLKETLMKDNIMVKVK